MIYTSVLQKDRACSTSTAHRLPETPKHIVSGPRQVGHAVVVLILVHAIIQGCQVEFLQILPPVHIVSKLIDIQIREPIHCRGEFDIELG